MYSIHKIPSNFDRTFRENFPSRPHYQRGALQYQEGRLDRFSSQDRVMMMSAKMCRMYASPSVPSFHRTRPLSMELQFQAGPLDRFSLEGNVLVLHHSHPCRCFCEIIHIINENQIYTISHFTFQNSITIFQHAF